jgi:hypothetical protein
MPCHETLNYRQEGVGLFSRDEPTINILEEHESHRFFDLADRLADSRLGYVKDVGGGSDRSLLVDGLYDLELPNVHVSFA